MKGGDALRDLRESLGLTLREVEAASIRLGEIHGNPDIALPISRISDIETKGTIPSIFRLYAFAVIYRTSLQELLSHFGLDIGRRAVDSLVIAPPNTHKAALEDMNSVRMPVKLDPGFEPSSTTNIARMVMRWGTVPLTFLRQFESSEFSYGYVGSQDFTMYPLLMPGSFVQVDETKRKPSAINWRTEYERPIYFVQTRSGYTCCWCDQDGANTLLIAHPLSPTRSRVARSERDVDIIGQVVAVAMRLDWKPDETAEATRLLSRSS